MKFIDRRTVTVILMIAAVSMLQTSALAQRSEQCRQINNRKERHDCYARQDAERASKPKKQPTKFDRDLDRLKRENDLMSLKLRSICKGC